MVRMMPAVDTVSVYNMFDAVKSIRKAFKTEEKSDSKFIQSEQLYKHALAVFCYSHCDMSTADETLALRLIKRGGSHRKFMRQIMVSFDIAAPMYWWKQFDTYKVGVTRNSESTMHTILKQELSQKDFALPVPEEMLKYLNNAISVCKNHNTQLEKDHMYMYIVNNLPSGYIQTSHITCSYENLLRMYVERHDHKLPEWKWFCNHLVTQLPYMISFINACEV